VLEVLEVMRFMLLCVLDAVEGRLCSLAVLEMLEVMRCMLLHMLDAVEGRLCSLEVMRRMLDAAFQGFEISIVAVFSSQSASELHSNAHLSLEAWATHGICSDIPTRSRTRR